MASVLNITDRLKKEQKQIQIGDDILTVNTAFEAMVEVEAIERSEIGDVEKMLKTLRVLLPGDGYEKLMSYNLDMQDMGTVFTAIMATIQAVPYEEMAARFQRATGAANK